MKLSARWVFPALVCAAALIAAPLLSGKATARTQAQAQVLDQAEFLCDNCFFGPSYYYFCFAVGDQTMIAYQRTPVLNWRDKTKNYLTRVRKKWNIWSPPTQPFPISYDEKHIWVNRESGKQVKLIRRDLRDIFTNDARCRPAAAPKAP